MTYTPEILNVSAKRKFADVPCTTGSGQIIHNEHYWEVDVTIRDKRPWDIPGAHICWKTCVVGMVLDRTRSVPIPVA